ncbi:MAG: alpha/beta hydrolase [Haloplasmataceae bacterium]|jgi:pimeloyl-ACP methyl ester carboxylesterase|nr:alpha/beta hydrolase [Haloplasmataceae bacterium]
MSEFNFNNHKVYYEVHGEGAPLLILNGIMMSTSSWKLFLNSFTKYNQLILVDFFDQGRSDKLDIDYKQDLQVDLVNELLNHLNVDKVNLVGISYGAEVAIQFTIKYQNRLNKLTLFNGAAYTSPWLHDIGRGWVETARTYNPRAFYKITIPIIYSPEFYNNNLNWMRRREEILIPMFNQTFLDAMVRLIESSEGYDLRNQIKEIKVPTLIVGCENDYLVPLHEQKFLHQEIRTSELVILPNCGHASMYERPALFISLVNGFINGNIDVSVL